MTTDQIPDRIAVVLCVDSRYLVQAAVTAGSLLDSNPGAEFDIVVAVLERDVSLSDAAFGKVRAEPRCRLSFRDLDPGMVSGLPETAQFSRSVYSRILIDRIVPQDCRRVLYLDADIVVNGDIAPLWTMPLGGAVLAAARDHFRIEMEAIGLAPDEAYFNSGVLLIDMPRWREERCEKRLLSFLAAKAHALPWMDQDAINIVLRGRIREAGLTWNFQPRCADVPASFLGLTGDEHRRLRKHPRIVHYTTRYKPWNAEHGVHYGELFFAAARRWLPAGLVPPQPRSATASARLQSAKRSLRWQFPRSFRFVRTLLRPAAAARMYRAGPDE